LAQSRSVRLQGSDPLLAHTNDLAPHHVASEIFDFLDQFVECTRWAKASAGLWIPAEAQDLAAVTGTQRYVVAQLGVRRIDQLHDAQHIANQHRLAARHQDVGPYAA
jgi:hypothetical protein